LPWRRWSGTWSEGWRARGRWGGCEDSARCGMTCEWLDGRECSFPSMRDVAAHGWGTRALVVMRGKADSFASLRNGNTKRLRDGNTKGLRDGNTKGLRDGNTKKGAEWKCKKAAGGRWKERRQSGTCQPPVVWAREILAVEGLLMAWAMAGKAAMISGVFAQTGTSLMT